MSVRKSGKIIAGTPRETGGVEIGDVGFAPLGIDESLNLRRYLNGQVISQSQFVSFTNKVKSAVALYPSLSTTETNWQAEKTNSKLGQCGKFVIDDTAGTIRLPCVVNAQGLTDLALIGGVKSESLPDAIYYSDAGWGTSSGDASRSLVASKGGYEVNNTGKGLLVGNRQDTTSVYSYSYGKLSASNSTYQNNAPVQQEAIQYPYYIQVATGVEETLPAIREYNINTPFFFGQSMYSDIAPDNASWLASNGQYNAKTVYPDYYDWLLEQMNAGKNQFKQPVGYAYLDTGSTGYFWWISTTNPVVGMSVYAYDPSKHFYVGGQIESVNENTFTFTFNNGSTQVQYTAARDGTYDTNNYEYGSYWITDYDFVVNQNDQTFRLPLLNGEEDLLGTTLENIPITPSVMTYTASKNGFLVGRQYSSTEAGFVGIGKVSTSEQQTRVNSGAGTASVVNLFLRRNETAAIEYINLYALSFIPAVGNGSLYYYVGDTVQDASLINAGAVLGQLANKADIDASNFNADGKSLLSGLGMPSGRYIDLTLGASQSTYTAPANGWFVLLTSGLTYLDTYRSNDTFGSISHPNNAFAREFVPMQKGQSLYVYYEGTPTNTDFRFYYAEGEV